MESLSEATALFWYIPHYCSRCVTSYLAILAKQRKRKKYLNRTHLNNKEGWVFSYAIFTTADRSVVSTSVTTTFYHKWQH